MIASESEQVQAWVERTRQARDTVRLLADISEMATVAVPVVTPQPQPRLVDTAGIDKKAVAQATGGYTTVALPVLERYQVHVKPTRDLIVEAFWGHVARRGEYPNVVYVHPIRLLTVPGTRWERYQLGEGSLITVRLEASVSLDIDQVLCTNV